MATFLVLLGSKWFRLLLLFILCLIASCALGGSVVSIPKVRPLPEPVVSFVTSAQILPRHRFIDFVDVDWRKGETVYHLENPSGFEWSQPACEQCGRWPDAVICARVFEDRLIITGIEPYRDLCPYCIDRGW